MDYEKLYLEWARATLEKRRKLSEWQRIGQASWIDEKSRLDNGPERREACMISQKTAIAHEVLEDQAVQHILDLEPWHEV